MSGNKEVHQMNGRLTFGREHALHKIGVKPVVGCDVAGRGAIAGAIVAAAVILDPDSIPHDLNDPKLLTPRQRDVLYGFLCTHAQVGLAWALPDRIDRDNVLRASLWAMEKAVTDLGVTPAFVLVNGRDRIDVGCDCEAIADGKETVASITAASIAAKVMRDRMMIEIGTRHPGYGFERHMGYSVPEHFAALDLFGPTIHHRRSFIATME